MSENTFPTEAFEKKPPRRFQRIRYDDRADYGPYSWWPFGAWKKAEDKRYTEWRKIWEAWYAEYLASPLWKKRKRFVLHRAEHRCELCGARAATVVHHRTYDRVGQEWPDDLAALCDDCHGTIHQK